MKGCLLGIWLFSTPVWAGSDYTDYLTDLAMRESSNNPQEINSLGYLGLYQMGELALIDAGYYMADQTPNTNDWSGNWTGKNGITSQADFLNNVAAQTQAITDYNQAQWGYITNLGLESYIGQTLGGVMITESGLLAGAHLVGVGGLQTFLQSNGASVPSDGNNTPITQYIGLLGGYNMASITGNSGNVGNTGNPSNPAPVNPGNPNNFVAPVSPVSIGNAFSASTNGVSTQNLLTVIQSIIGVLLLLWTAFVSWGQFKLWGERNINIMAMQTNIIRATVVMMLLLYIFLI